jgi:hypothetical protein
VPSSFRLVPDQAVEANSSISLHLGSHCMMRFIPLLSFRVRRDVDVVNQVFKKRTSDSKCWSSSARKEIIAKIDKIIERLVGYGCGGVIMLYCWKVITNQEPELR